MKLYAIETTIAATAYIKADSPQDAANKWRAEQMTTIEVEGGIIDGRPFKELMEDSSTPDVTFSPAMTIGRQACPLIEEIEL